MELVCCFYTIVMRRRTLWGVRSPLSRILFAGTTLFKEHTALEGVKQVQAGTGSASRGSTPPSLSPYLLAGYSLLSLPSSLMSSCPDDHPKGGGYTVNLFYRYASLDAVEELVVSIHCLCSKLRLKGRCLVSQEGINGTLAGSNEAVLSFECLLQFLDAGFTNIDFKHSFGQDESLPFQSLSVRQVDELIAPGSRKGALIKRQVYFDESYGGLNGTGSHLTPRDFHSQVVNLLADPRQGLLLDVRNVFESDIGRFKGAVPLDTYYYSESWDAMDTRIEDFVGRNGKSPSKILLYCTGGIRCEKASAYLRAKGFDGVFQLQGGIHKYLDEYGQSAESLFIGKNYVFDSRMAIANNKTQILISCSMIGHCIACDSPFDTYRRDIFCTVCRYPVLICAQCFECSVHKEFHCRRHNYLQGIYFTNLEKFSMSQLMEQESKLSVIASSLKGQQLKSRRRMLNVQRVRILERITALKIGN